MKKKNFVSMILGTVGGILFAVGMCMCLLPEWNAFNAGIVMGIIGAVILLAMLIIRRKMEGKPKITLNRKAIGAIILGIISTLVFGLGMCMTMIWEGLMIPGIIVGIVGIIMFLFIIPLYKGIK